MDTSRRTNDVTVIITWYGQQEHLLTQMEFYASMAKRYDYKPRVIIINDANEPERDFFIECVNSYKPLFKLTAIDVKPDIGFNSHTCRNLGAKLAKTDWIMFLDADTYESEGFYEELRFNKELVVRFKKIMAYETDNILITEITNLSKKVIEKDIISKLDGDGCFIDCSSPYDSEIESYLKNNLPVFLNKNEHIKVLLEMYEGNFSALLNDLEILKILEIKEEREAMTIFTSNGDKNNYKLIEHISNNESDSALSIINSMKKKDRNSVPLLIWILARDINAIKFIKDGKNLKTLGIWDNQINMYKRISDRTSRESINKSINTLDGIDKCFKGVLNGDPWNGIKDIVLELSG